MPASYFLSDKYKEVSLAFLGSDLPFFRNSFSSYYLCFVDLMWRHSFSTCSRGGFTYRYPVKSELWVVSSLVCNWAIVISYRFFRGQKAEKLSANPPSHKDEIVESRSAFSGIPKKKTAAILSGTGYLYAEPVLNYEYRNK